MRQPKHDQAMCVLCELPHSIDHTRKYGEWCCGIHPKCIWRLHLLVWANKKPLGEKNSGTFMMEPVQRTQSVGNKLLLPQRPTFQDLGSIMLNPTCRSGGGSLCLTCVQAAVCARMEGLNCVYVYF